MREAVVTKYRGEARAESTSKCGIELLRQSSSNESLSAVIEWLWMADCLNSKYNLLTDNCKHFAEIVYARFSSQNRIVSLFKLLDIFSVIACKYGVFFSKVQLNPSRIFKQSLAFIRRQLENNRLFKMIVDLICQVENMNLPTLAGAKTLPENFNETVIEIKSKFTLLIQMSSLVYTTTF